MSKGSPGDLEHFPKWCRPGIHWYPTHFRRRRGNGWGTEVYSKSENALRVVIPGGGGVVAFPGTHFVGEEEVDPPTEPTTYRKIVDSAIKRK
jgi:hypothetical protein